MKVYKFGGTSVGLPERMYKVADIITKDNQQKIVVLSALSGTTNTLVNIGEQLLQQKREVALLLVKELKQHYKNFIDQLYKAEDSKKEGGLILEKHFKEIEALALIPDFNTGNNKTLVAYGEIISTNLFHLYLNETGINNKLLNALDFMKKDSQGEPDIDFISKELGKRVDDETGIFITQGFICRDIDGKTDNLERGGSDYSASLIGAAIKADEVQIWTDIDGMHNNDPRMVDPTYPISKLSFNEAAELAYFGAKILHPSSILPAQKFGIPVCLKSTLNPEATGTVIGIESGTGDIKAIAAKDNITAIKIKSTRMLLAYGFLRQVFEVFEYHKTSIDMITTSEVAVSVTIDNDTHLKAIVEDLEKFGLVEVDQSQTIICMVGDLVSTKTGVLKRIFDSIADIPVRMVSYGGSKNNISLLVDSGYKVETLKGLNKGLF